VQYGSVQYGSLRQLGHIEMHLAEHGGAQATRILQIMQHPAFPDLSLNGWLATQP